MFRPGFLILFLKSMAWKFSGIIKSGMRQKAASVSKTPLLMGRRDKKFVAEEEMYSPSGFLKQRPERGGELRKH